LRLLLDEMISPRIARHLRDRGWDVDAVKRFRPDLEGLPDHRIVRRMAAERRAVVTNNVIDFLPLHARILTADEEHYGIIFTSDATMPRSKATILLWVEALDKFLGMHPDEDALRNRVVHLL
jgi:predicted nuclease of predicted toxin-antitoxin system